MLDVVIKVIGLAVGLFNSIVKAIEMIHNYKHQKSNRSDQS